MKNKFTVTIGTTAFNEEENIQNMLTSVVNQKEDETFSIKEIVVISDGSTDKTPEKSLLIKDKRIKVINHKTRKGQPARIDEILRLFDGDILILIDSDMVMKDKFVVKKLITPFLKNNKIGLVAGNTIPLNPQTFLEAAINNYIYARLKYLNETDFAKTAYCAHGFLAYSRKFGKSLHISKYIFNYDAFSYFSCLSMGFGIDFKKDAIAYYRSPQKIKDHINQSTRHLVGGLQLEKYFGSQLVKKRFSIPKQTLIKILIYQLLRNPLGYIFLKFLNFYCMYRSKNMLKNLDIKWVPIISSKRIVN